MIYDILYYLIVLTYDIIILLYLKKAADIGLKKIKDTEFHYFLMFSSRSSI